MHELNAIITIAARDFTKLLRDKTRFIAGFIFPALFIAALGGSLSANWNTEAGYDLMTFVFTGVLAQTLFQSTAAGLISLIEDRSNDFAQEMFIAPISRYSIIIGKILGETLVALTQALTIFLLGFILGIPLSLAVILKLIPIMVIICLFGGAFGVLVMSHLGTERTANQIFPFLIFPQFFLAGVFNPIKNLPFYLFILSRIAPMTYAVDFLRSIFYAGKPEAANIVLFSPLVSLTIIVTMFVVFSIYGTWRFVSKERNR